MKPIIRSVKLLTAGLAVAAVAVSLVHGKPEYSKKEAKACVACHIKNGAKELNDVGRCYQEKQSLKECETWKGKRP